MSNLSSMKLVGSRGSANNQNHKGRIVESLSFETLESRFNLSAWTLADVGTVAAPRMLVQAPQSQEVAVWTYGQGFNQAITGGRYVPGQSNFVSRVNATTSWSSVRSTTVVTPTVVTPTVVTPTVVTPTVIKPTVVTPTVVAPKIITPTTVTLNTTTTNTTTNTNTTTTNSNRYVPGQNKFVMRINATSTWNAVDHQNVNIQQPDQALLVNQNQPQNNPATTTTTTNATTNNNNPTPAPAVTPAPVVVPPAYTTPVTVSEFNMTSFTELYIQGTNGNDHITVDQSGSTIIVTANGHVNDYTGQFGNIVVHGGAGAENITIDPNVTVDTLIYAGKQASVLKDFTQGKATIVSVGGSGDVLQGNGVNTSYWASGSDQVNASAAEIAQGGVHIINNFYQPFTTNPSSPNYVSTQLNGQSITQPTDSGATIKLTQNSLWGTGPTMNDVNQGQLADCYFLANIQALAQNQPGRLQNMAVDLGDGTYAVQFFSNGQATYVRVDASLPGNGYYAVGNQGSLMYAHPGASGDIWAPIMEKAYAYFRGSNGTPASGQNTYASLNYGWSGSVFNDLGVNWTNLDLGQNGQSLYNAVTSGLNSGHSISMYTGNNTNSGVVADHEYSMVSASDQNGQISFVVRNPWGFNQGGADLGNGLLQLSLAQLQSNFGGALITT